MNALEELQTMASKTFSDLMNEKKRPDEFVGRYDAGNVDIVFTSLETPNKSRKKDEVAYTATFEMKKRGVKEEGSLTFTGHLGSVDPWTFEPVRKHTFKITKHTNNCPDWFESCWGDKSLFPYGTNLAHFLTENLREEPDKYLNQTLNYIYYRPYHLEDIERLEFVIKRLQKDNEVERDLIVKIVGDVEEHLHSDEAQEVLSKLKELLYNWWVWKKDHQDEKNESFEKKSSELIEELKNLTLPPKNTPM